MITKYCRVMDSFCTIVDTKYIPQALALVDSVQHHHPEVSFTLLITDIDQPFEHESMIEVVTPRDLEISDEKLLLMLDFYDSIELATSLKPFLLKYLLSHGAESATFIDPDVLLFSRIDNALEIARSGFIVLTPHRLNPIKNSASFYSEDTFLRYGIYNLGFLSLNSRNLAALDWWGEILTLQCTRYPNDHLFTDQKWVDHFPVYFNAKISRDPGMNVAPWNLDEREITVRDGKYFSNHVPLKFVHFSQMSAYILEGKFPKLWGAMLSRSEAEQNSLEMLDNLSRNYRVNLHSKSMSDFMKLALARSNKQTRKSLAYRMCKNSLAKRSKSRALNALKYPKFWWLLKNFWILDNVSTYSALINTIPRDLKRLKSKLIFKSRN